MKSPRSSLYIAGIRGFWVLFAAGVAVVAYGGVTKNASTTNMGIAIFLSSIALWGFGNGGVLAWGEKERIKGGLSSVVKDPWIVLMALFFISLGVCCTWFIVFRILR